MNKSEASTKLQDVSEDIHIVSKLTNGRKCCLDCLTTQQCTLTQQTHHMYMYILAKKSTSKAVLLSTPYADGSDATIAIATMQVVLNLYQTF